MSPRQLDGRMRRRGYRPGIALLATTVVVAGCASDKAEEDSIASPTTVAVSPNAFAGVPLPDDAVQKAVDKLDDLANQVLTDTGVPGMAIAVVHDGKVVYAKGFGVKDVAGDDKVDADTVFQIASVSKSISATVVAQQVSEGKIAWDTPIRQSLPSFALADPWVSDHVTVGDLFSHRSGLPGAAGDKLEDLGFDRGYILDKLRLEPLSPFRDSYAYSNFGLTTAAEAVAVNAGMEWADLAAEVLYRPLGMNVTSSKYDEFLTRENRATLHMKIDGKYVHDLDRDPDAQAPAGGVSSSVNDLAKWLQLMLGDGTIDGKQIYKPEAFQPAVTPQAVTGVPHSLDARAGTYGFGFNVVTTPAGRTSFNHSGAFISGAATNVLVIPSADVAIVTLTNAWPTGVPETVNESFADLVQFGKIEQDWAGLFPQVMAPLEEPVGSLAGQSPPASPAPAKPLADYVGAYANDFYGPATITERNGSLVLGLGPAGKTFPLNHWDGDTFTFTLLTENAPPGTISKATFDGNRLNLEYYDDGGLGTFVR